MRPLIKFLYCVLLQSQLSSLSLLPWMLRSSGKHPVLSPSSCLQSRLLAASPGAVPHCGEGQDLGFAACTVFHSWVHFTRTESGQWGDGTGFIQALGFSPAPDQG